MIAFYIAITIPFCTFVMRGFFLTVPWEIQEAARSMARAPGGLLADHDADGEGAACPSRPHPVHVDMERPLSSASCSASPRMSVR